MDEVLGFALSAIGADPEGPPMGHLCLSEMETALVKAEKTKSSDCAKFLRVDSGGTILTGSAVIWRDDERLCCFAD